tara:strand:+ start:812 stop:1324 length:513 start_codon:yes stop_codon:yes gene_type:complete
MKNNAPMMKSFPKLFIAFLILPFFLICSAPIFAKTPPEIRNQDELKITQDMHGRDLNGYEFIKSDLRGVDLSDSDLTGAVFNNSKLVGANLRNADLEDIVAFASDFTNADLRQANLSNALLMESDFSEVMIEGADFTDAVLNRIQLKQLCSIAESYKSSEGDDTSYSLGC